MREGQSDPVEGAGRRPRDQGHPLRASPTSPSPKGPILKPSRPSSPRRPSVEIDQKNCEFIPYVAALNQEQSVVFKSSDPINHNVRFSAFVNAPFNQILPPNGQVSLKLVAERRPIPLACDIHPWMKGYIMVFDHPFFAITGEDGSFEITGRSRRRAETGRLAGDQGLRHRRESGRHAGDGQSRRGDRRRRHQDEVTPCHSGRMTHRRLRPSRSRSRVRLSLPDPHSIPLPRGYGISFPGESARCVTALPAFCNCLAC